jgi:hypothetical protein
MGRRCRIRTLILRITCCLLIALSIPSELSARVVRVVIETRQDVLGGRSWGDAGPYERITGRVYFEFDPSDPANARIVDLALVPRNERGMVEAWANFMVLRPKDPSRGSDIALLEVSNRGGKASLGYFNAAAFSRNPEDEEHFGDGFLMRQGLTVIWVGWQFDVPPAAEDLLRLHVPIARGPEGQPITGLVRADWVIAEPTRTLALGHRNHWAYSVSDPESGDVVLTVRRGREGERLVVPRTEWRFAEETDAGVRESLTHIYAPAGFEPGGIYELVYPAADPRVVGLGLAAIRDMISHAKYDPESAFRVRHGIGIGISQTGRFLRHFLYQGFNVDEDGRKAFDGLMIHTAGAGRGSFNHRFGQPSRDGHRFSAFFYPTDLFPFSGRTQRDELTGQEDGVLEALAPEHRPKVFYTNTGYEYWGRAASLLHTTPGGQEDVEPLPEERIYHFASAQHFVERAPFRDWPRLTTGEEAAAFRGNDVNFLLNLRALLTRMMDWVGKGESPPDSRYPRIADGTLVPIDQVRFPAIPGVAFPDVIHVAYRADYGPRWPEGVVTKQPPKLGRPFPSLASQVDELGNEIGGLRNVEIRVPLATYAPWSLRVGLPGPRDELADFRGTTIPLPRDAAEKNRTGDPRPAISSLYASREAYLAEVEASARQLVAEGYLLGEDLARVLDAAGRRWERWGPG